MKIDDLDLDNNEEIKMRTLDVNKVRNHIPTYSSEKLSEMIVVERYIGFHPDISVMCMEELAKRRMEGDPFPFEDYIENAFNSLPSLDFKILDLRNVLINAISKKPK